MASLPISLVTPEEYLAWEREQERKHEYFDGEIVSMAGASVAHLVIVSNLTDLISPALRKAGCRVFSSDLRVSVMPDTFCYPDLTIACPPFEFLGKSSDTLLNPTFLIEVLSPSTRGTDRAIKLPRYRNLPSLRGYLFVEQDRVAMEYGRRAFGEEWQSEVLTSLNDRVDLAPLPCVAELAAIYTDVQF